MVVRVGWACDGNRSRPSWARRSSTSSSSRSSSGRCVLLIDLVPHTKLSIDDHMAWCCIQELCIVYVLFMPILIWQVRAVMM
jgi:hypothetical protein